MKLFVAIVVLVLFSMVYCHQSLNDTSTALNDQDKELKMVHIIMRHGIRTPVDTYPKDPFISHDFAPNGWGQLTKGGILDLYQLGKYLRERYGHFLGTHFSASKFHAQATGVDRALASIMSVNSGLWQPVDADQKAIDGLDWFPVPVNSEPLDTDMLLLVRPDCPQYNIELTKVENSIEIKNKLEEYKDLFEYIEKSTGKTIHNFYDVEDVFTTLLAEKAYGLELPAWTQGYFPDKMAVPASFSYVLKAYNSRLQRLKGGVLLKKLLGDWNRAKASGEGAIKPDFYLYGGHDTTVSNLLSTLQVFDQQVPNYAIAIMFELSKDKNTGEFGLEIFLRNSSSIPPYQLQLPGCEIFCPLTKLAGLVSPVIPQNWAEECKTSDEGYTEPPKTGP